jgi:hypothetical protein
MALQQPHHGIHAWRSDTSDNLIAEMAKCGASEEHDKVA